ncbi:MAG: hypothetical protein VKJ04_07035 [Vampirovibrionales bacterium]|nr:hypothetical protein [Vampirovibrionales bacterium]
MISSFFSASQNHFRPSAFRASGKGFTLLELCVIFGIVAVLSAVAIGNWATTTEVRDAAAVQSGQAALQQVISQGSTRADTSPANLLASQRNNVLTAANLLMQNRRELVFSNAAPNVRLSITTSGRWANFSVDADGNVVLQALSADWTDFTVDNGVITRRH